MITAASIILALAYCLNFCDFAESQYEFYFQRLELFRPDGNSMLFAQHIPDTTPYKYFFSQVDHICVSGRWMTYSNVNYTGFIEGIGSVNNAETTCIPWNFDNTRVKSLRFRGNVRSWMPAISLYEGDYYEGTEESYSNYYYVRNINMTVRTVAGIGSGFWGEGQDSYTLFEGPELDGKSFCLEVPAYPGGYSNFGYVKDFGLTAVGSLAATCDEQLIQSYRENKVPSRKQF